METREPFSIGKKAAPKEIKLYQSSEEALNDVGGFGRYQVLIPLKKNLQFSFSYLQRKMMTFIK